MDPDPNWQSGLLRVTEHWNLPPSWCQPIKIMRDQIDARSATKIWTTNRGVTPPHIPVECWNDR